MIPELEALKKLAAGTINKGRLAAIQTAHANACTLHGQLAPKPDDEDAADEFDDAASQLEDALMELDSACDELDAAEDKEERADATDQLAGALEEAVSSLEAALAVAVIVTVDESAIREEAKAKWEELISLPPEQSFQAVLAWIESAGSPLLAQKRAQAIKDIMHSLGSDSSKPTA